MPALTLTTSAIPQDPQTLALLKKRAGLLLAILTPAILLTFYLVASESRAPRVADLAAKAIPDTLIAPHQVWTSTDMTITPEELAILETNDYVFRTYTDGKGSPVDLCIVFSDDNRKGTHPPDICLEGSGYRIVSRNLRPTVIAGTPLTLCEIVANSTSSSGPGSYVYFAYFYKCGDTFTPSFYRQQMQIIWNGLTSRNAAGALIRFSVPMENSSDIDLARGRADELLALTFPHIRDGLSTQR